MSFASDVKNELCSQWDRTTADCCLKAQLYGLLLLGRSFSLQAVQLATEHAAVRAVFEQTLAQKAGLLVEASRGLQRKGGGHVSCTLSLPDAAERKRLLAWFGHTGSEVNLRINRANLENECCVASFLRGAFLACGTVTDPRRDYHLELYVPHMKLAGDLHALLAEAPGLLLDPGITKRKGAYIIYLKDSERIADMLAYIGAPGAAMELMQAKMVKEVRNYVNRTTNFETANISKTAAAAARQLQAIQLLDEKIGLAALPEDLREIAALRRDSPELSLRELGEALSEPLSRSGVNHRLKRLVELARQMGLPDAGEEEEPAPQAANESGKGDA